METQLLRNESPLTCIVCNKTVGNDSSKFLEESVPQVEPIETVIEALKLLSNFKYVHIDTEEHKICGTCFLHTAEARSFQQLCNKSAEKFETYINTPRNIKEEHFLGRDVIDNQSERLYPNIKTEAIFVTATQIDEEQNEDDHINEDTLGANSEEEIAKPVVSYAKRKECPHCKKLFYFSYLRRHITNKHANKLPHKCNVCKKGFCLKQNLEIHIREQHKEQICTDSTKSETQDIPVQVQTVAISIDKTEENAKESGKHVKAEEVVIPRNQVQTEDVEIEEERPPARQKACPYCKKLFYFDYVRKHIRKKHPHRLPHRCSMCKKVFSLKKNLEKHIGFHHNGQICIDSTNVEVVEEIESEDEMAKQGRQKQCPYCTKSFSYDYVRKHIKKKHPNKVPHKCNMCKKLFSRKANLEKHIHSHHNEQNGADSINKTQDSQIQAEKVVIPTDKIEEKQSGNEDNLGANNQSDEEDNIALSELKLKTTAVAGGNSSKAVKRKRIYGPVGHKECPFCKKTFRSDYMSRHIRTHTGELPHKCHLCTKAFRLKETLNAHILYHKNERNFLCTICGKGFFLKLTLQNHIRIHTNERPYICETCGKSFRTSQGRRIHYSVHSDERPWACETCPKTFATSRSLRQHKIVHYEVKPWECTFCGKRFPHKHVLLSHQAKTCPRINHS